MKLNHELVEKNVGLLAILMVIAISLGPLFKNSPQGLKTARLVIEAARQAGVFAVVQGWEDIFDQLDLPETMLAVRKMGSQDQASSKTDSRHRTNRLFRRAFVHSILPW